MALVSCPECSNQVSDAAVSCPSCGHPLQSQMQATAVEQAAPKSEKKELFKADGANFVLDEIAAVSSVKTRNWVYLVVGLPVIAAVIFSWMNQDWPVAAVVTVIGLFILGFIYVDQGQIASTGNITDIKEDMEKVSQRYHDSLNQSELVVYTGRNTFLDMQFSVNPDRVAEFSKASSYGHIWMYVLAVVVAAGASELAIPLLYAGAAGLALLGFLSRKASLEITGVGGAKLQLYTKAGDIKRVIEELTRSIEQQEKA